MQCKTGLRIYSEALFSFIYARRAKLLRYAAGRPYLLHSCGKLDVIMDYFIDEVKIDAKHSFEDTIGKAFDILLGRPPPNYIRYYS